MEVKMLLLVPFLSPLFLSAHNTNALPKPYFEAIYQFGDSISDTGNRMIEFTRDGCSSPPYGETFFGRPTGRCSDGRLMIDFFAEALGLPFLDPYLDKNGNFTHGVNFAVGGATALNSSGLGANNIPMAWTRSSLSVQLDWFKSHLNTLHSATPSELKKKLGKALFLVGEIGGNDYNYAAAQGKTMQELHALVPEVIQTIMHVVEELINVGAKRVIVPGNFPVGCISIYLDVFKTHDRTMYDEFNCLKSWNWFAAFHNTQLQYAIRDLQKKYPDVAIVYGNYYTPLRSILKYAPSLGFERDGLLMECCKACGFKEAPLCPDPKKRVIWDGIHFTEHTYQLMAKWLFKDYVVTNSPHVS